MRYAAKIFIDALTLLLATYVLIIAMAACAGGTQ